MFWFFPAMISILLRVAFLKLAFFFCFENNDSFCAFILSVKAMCLPRSAMIHPILVVMILWWLWYPEVWPRARSVGNIASDFRNHECFLGRAVSIETSESSSLTWSCVINTEYAFHKEFLPLKPSRPDKNLDSLDIWAGKDYSVTCAIHLSTDKYGILRMKHKTITWVYYLHRTLYFLSVLKQIVQQLSTLVCFAALNRRGRKKICPPCALRNVISSINWLQGKHDLFYLGRKQKSLLQEHRK